MTEKSDASPDGLIRVAAEFIRKQWSQTPRYGIVLGTGAGEIAKQIQVETTLEYRDIPHFPISTALGHRGALIGGKLAGEPVVAMQGRFHLYEGYSFEMATLPIRVMHQLGVQTLIVSNASGGINPRYRGGEIMAIESHLDLMLKTSPHFKLPGSLAAPSDSTPFNSVPFNSVRFNSAPFHSSPSLDVAAYQRPLFRSDVYDPGFIESAIATGWRNGFTVHRGVYAGVLGPNYETRAEYRFLQRVGADVVGMSTVPEVAVAAHCGMRVLGLSIVSNTANPDALAATSGQEVIDAAAVAAPHLLTIVTDIIEANR